MHAEKDAGRGALLRLLLVYMLWTAAGVTGGSFVYLFCKDAGVGMDGLVSSFLFWAAAPVLVIHFLKGRQLDIRLVLIAGAVANAAAYFLLTLPLFPVAPLLLLYISSFLWGTVSFLFWVPLNIMYFELSKGREAMLSSIYFSMSSIFGIVLPLAIGAVAAAYGFPVVFGISTAAYIAVIPLALLMIPSRRFSFDLQHCIAGLKGFKTLMLLEGVYGGAMAAALSIIPLFYFTSPVELGAYLSITTLFSVLASLAASRFSDKSRKRKKYIAAFGAGLGISSAICSLAGTAFLWSAAVSLRNFFATLFYPFTTTIMMDNRKEPLGHAMVGREWLLNYGRVAGIALVFACAMVGSINISLAFAGLLIIAYPAVIEMKKRHIRVE